MTIRVGNDGRQIYDASRPSRSRGNPSRYVERNRGRGILDYEAGPELELRQSTRQELGHHAIVRIHMQDVLEHLREAAAVRRDGRSCAVSGLRVGVTAAAVGVHVVFDGRERADDCSCGRGRVLRRWRRRLRMRDDCIAGERSPPPLGPRFRSRRDVRRMSHRPGDQVSRLRENPGCTTPVHRRWLLGMLSLPGV